MQRPMPQSSRLMLLKTIKELEDQEKSSIMLDLAPGPLFLYLHSNVPFEILNLGLFHFFLFKKLIENNYIHVQFFSPQIESRKRVAKTVLVLVGLFAFCWLPNHILYLYRSFTYHASIDTSAFHLVATIFSRALAFSNSCVNPFALYWLSKSFRQHFKKEVLCCKRKVPKRRASITQSNTPSRAMSVTGSEISVTLLTDYSITKEEESV